VGKEFLMKMIASLVCRNELNRYLELCVSHLLEFVDEIRIVDDGSTDGWEEALRGAWGKDGNRVLAKKRDRTLGGAFVNHADARNELLQFTLEGWPDWILDLDFDEFVSDGAALRRRCEAPGATRLSLTMEEIWQAEPDCLCVREDGGWRSHEVMMLWKPDMARRGDLQIFDKGPATGRTPEVVSRQLAERTGVQALHFGWTNVAERQERFERYQQADGGRFHSGAHLQSIMWPDEKITLRARPWPAGLAALRPALEQRIAS
jgi:hypothetical protein